MDTCASESKLLGHSRAEGDLILKERMLLGSVQGPGGYVFLMEDWALFIPQEVK